MSRHPLLTSVVVGEQMDAICLLTDAMVDLQAVSRGASLENVRIALAAVAEARLHILLANHVLELTEEYRRLIMRERPEVPRWYFEPTLGGPMSAKAYYEAAFGMTAPTPTPLLG